MAVSSTRLPPVPMHDPLLMPTTRMSPETTATMAALSATTTIPLQTLTLSAPEWDPRVVEATNDAAIVQHIRDRYKEVHQFSCYPIVPPLFMQTPLVPGLLTSPQIDEPAIEDKPISKRGKSGQRRSSAMSRPEAAVAAPAAAAVEIRVEPLHLATLRTHWQEHIDNKLYTKYTDTTYVADGDPDAHLGIFGVDANPLEPVIAHAVAHTDKPFLLHYVAAVTLQYYATKKACFMHIRTDKGADRFSELHPPWLLVLVRGTDCTGNVSSPEPLSPEENRKKPNSRKRSRSSVDLHAEDEDDDGHHAAKTRGRPRLERPVFREPKTRLTRDNLPDLLRRWTYPQFMLAVFRWIQNFSDEADKLLNKGSSDSPARLAQSMHDNLAGTLSVDSHFRELIPAALVRTLQEDYQIDTRLMPSVCLEDSIVSNAASAKTAIQKQKYKKLKAGDGNQGAAAAAVDTRSFTPTQIKLLQLQLDHIPRVQCDRLPIILCHQTFCPQTPIVWGREVAHLLSALFFIPKCETVRRPGTRQALIDFSLSRQVKSRDSYTFFIDAGGVARVTVPRLLATTGAIRDGHLPVDDLSLAAMSRESWRWCRRNGNIYGDCRSALRELIEQGKWKLVTVQSVVVTGSSTRESQSEAEGLDRQVKSLYSSEWNFFARNDLNSNLVWIYKRSQPLTVWQKELIIRGAFRPLEDPRSHLEGYWLMRAIQYMSGCEEDGIATIYEQNMEYRDAKKSESQAIRDVEGDINRDLTYAKMASETTWDLCTTPPSNPLLARSSAHSRRWSALFPASQIRLLANGTAQPWNRLLQSASLCPMLDMAFTAVSNLFAYNSSIRSELDHLTLRDIPPAKVAALRAIATFVLVQPEHEQARVDLLSKIGATAMKSNSMQSPLDVLERIVECEKAQNGLVSQSTLEFCYRRIAESVPDTTTAIAICHRFKQQHVAYLPYESPPNLAFATPPLRPFNPSSRLHTPTRGSGGGGRARLDFSVFASPAPAAAAEGAALLSMPFHASDHSFHSVAPS